MGAAALFISGLGNLLPQLVDLRVSPLPGVVAKDEPRGDLIFIVIGSLAVSDNFFVFGD